jgi:hypothetical protein
VRAALDYRNRQLMCRRPYRVARIREATDAEIAAKARIDDLVARQLPSVRATAQNWRNGVGFGAVASTLVGLFKAPDIIKGASEQQVANGAWLLGIGVLLAVLSFSGALRASFGWPAFERIASESDLRRWESDELAATIRYLRWSMVLAVLAFLGFCAASAVLIFHVPLPVHFPTWDR